MSLMEKKQSIDKKIDGFYNDEDLSNNMGFKIHEKTTSIVELIDKIEFSDISKEIIELYLTGVSYNVSKTKFRMKEKNVEPSEQNISLMEFCLKKDLKACLLKSTLYEILKMYGSSKLPQKSIKIKNYEEETIFGCDNQEILKLLKLYVREVMDKAYQDDQINSFEEVVDFKIPELVCINYFDMLEMNLSRFVESELNSADFTSKFKFNGQRTNQLKLIEKETLSLNDIEIKKYNKEFNHFLNTLQFISNLSENNSILNKSLSFLMLNEGKRYVDIVFNVNMLRKEGDLEFSVHSIDSFKKNKIERNKMKRDKLAHGVHRNENKELSRIVFSENDMYCTERFLLSLGISGDINYYLESGLLKETLFSNLTTFVINQYSEMNELTNIDAKYRIFIELRNHEFLSDEILLAIKDLNEYKNKLETDELLFHIRQCTYYANFFNKYRKIDTDDNINPKDRFYKNVMKSRKDK